MLEVVHRRQAVIEQLLGVKQMRQVGAAVRRAALAGTLLDRLRIVAVRALAMLTPSRRERRAGRCARCGSASRSRTCRSRRAIARQIPRACRPPSGSGAALRASLGATAPTTPCITRAPRRRRDRRARAVERQRGDLRQVRAPQSRRRCRPARCRTAAGPAPAAPPGSGAPSAWCAPSRSSITGAGRVGRRTLVERHRDVAAQQRPESASRARASAGAASRRGASERDAVVVDRRAARAG